MIGVFRIQRTLGVGGFGITYLALDTVLNLQVAVKEYFPQSAWREGNSNTVNSYSDDPQHVFQVGLNRFYKEGQTLAQFKHPNIVMVRQMLSENNTAYLVMDYEQGEELGTYLKQLGRPLTSEEAESIFNPLLDGLRAVHDRGLLHLDIKPENIFLRNDSTPVLIDFGGARYQAGKKLREVSFMVVADGFSPSEQYSGVELQPSSDIYATAATIYLSIAGVVPADSPIRANAIIDGLADPLLPISQLVKEANYSANFLTVLDSALSMRVVDRPSSVREFQQRLFDNTEPKNENLELEEKEAPKPSRKIDKKPLFMMIVGVGIALVLMTVLIQMPSANMPASPVIEIPTSNLAALGNQNIIPPEKETSTRADSVLELINNYADISSANNPYAQLSLYTDVIDFYNKKQANHEFIIQESKRYAGIYTDRKFKVISAPKLLWISEKKLNVSYKMSYTLCCKKNQGSKSGILLMKMGLVKRNSWKVTSINSEKL